MSSLERSHQSVLRISRMLYGEETKNELDVILNDAYDEITALKAMCIKHRDGRLDLLEKLIVREKQLFSMQNTANDLTRQIAECQMDANKYRAYQYQKALIAAAAGYEGNLLRDVVSDFGKKEKL